MADLLPGDNPQAYIPGDRRRALARGEDLPRRTHGSAVFVDISGFTPLTEALARELGARRGAEELSATLDRIFAALLEPLHVWDGSVVYFSGDAVTAWIDGDDGSRGAECGLAMQQVMQRVGVVQTPGGVPITLGVKVAVAVGEVHRFVVGDPRVQLIDVLAGALMDSLAAAEQQCNAGEVVLDAGAIASLGDGVRLREVRAGGLGEIGVVGALVDPPFPPDSPARWPQLPEATAREWLLPPVWERMATGRGEFVSDLRPAVPIFVRFGGLDFERDASAPEVLDDFVTRAELALDEQGGYVLQLTIGDKGAYLYAVFGSPIAHEDDAARACEAALRLLEIADEVPVTDVQVGGDRPPPQRHLRAPRAPYVLLPRRRGQPRRPPDDPGPRGRHLGARRRGGRRRGTVRVGGAALDHGEGSRAGGARTPPPRPCLPASRRHGLVARRAQRDGRS
ncbi:MAG: adenylate/guanylate cyclase domain-containing protein [Nocardioides sp.]